MSKWMSMALAPMLLAGCSAPAADGAQPVQDNPEMGSTPGSTCRNGDFSRFVGRPASAALATEARDRAGAGIVRWLQPGQIVTMEYRNDRLNIELDARNRVIAIRCG